MISIIDGDPGLGKSLITLALAAALSQGRPIVLGVPSIGPFDVLILAAEDDAARTIKPRLRAAGANLERVHIVDGLQSGETIKPVRFPKDLPWIRDFILKHRVRLVIIDPIMGFLDGQVDAHKDQSIRDVLSSLKRVAEETGATLVMIRHLNKKAGDAAMYRGGGSIAITAAARSALVVGKVPDQAGVCAITVAKCNLSSPTRAMTYSISTIEGFPVIVWGQEIELSADDLLPATPERRGQKQDMAHDWLAKQLGNGPLNANEVMDRGKAAGHSEKTLQRAAKALGVERRKVGYAGRWVWSLTSKMANSSPGTSDLGIFEETNWIDANTPEDGQSDFSENLLEDGPGLDGFVEGEL
jgi:hypothetical protein